MQGGSVSEERGLSVWNRAASSEKDPSVADEREVDLSDLLDNLFLLHLFLDEGSMGSYFFAYLVFFLTSALLTSVEAQPFEGLSYRSC